MKAFLPFLLFLLSLPCFAQNKTTNTEIHFFNYEVFGHGIHRIFNSQTLDTLFDLEDQFSRIEFGIYISVSYIGTHKSNLKLTQSMCN